MSYSEAYEKHPFLNAIKWHIITRNVASVIVARYDGFSTDYRLEEQSPERKSIYNACGVISRNFVSIKHPVFEETGFDVAEFDNKKAPSKKTTTKSFTDVEEFSKKINGVAYKIAFRRNNNDSVLEYDYFRIGEQ